MPPTRLIYASNHGGLGAGVLDDILLTSRANNKRDGITGVLVTTDEDFMQLLEGERLAVAECMMRIMQDMRHQNIRILLAGEIEALSFAQWSMHSIETSRVDQAIMKRYLINGGFYPDRMSQAAIESLCEDLSLRKIWARDAR